MAGEAPKPGLEALMSCQKQEGIAIKNFLDDVAMHLRNEEILDELDYQDATDSLSQIPKNKRAKIVSDGLADMIIHTTVWVGIL